MTVSPVSPVSPAPMYVIYVWRGIAAGWQRCSYAPRSHSDAVRLASIYRRLFPSLTYRAVAV